MPIIDPIGSLSQHPDIPEWWVSPPVPVPFFAGEELRFIITMELTGTDFPPDVQTAIANFLALDERERLAASVPVYRHYRDFVDAVDVEELAVSDPHEIWRHVTPTEIYVSRRSRRDMDVYVQVACECAWEQEHGLQLVFRQGAPLSRVSDQDGHLTHADAYDLPEDQEQT